MASANFTVMANNAAAIPNPERGFFYATANGLLNGSFSSELDIVINAGFRLTRSQTDLSAFIGIPISGAALTTMTTNIGLLRTKGVKSLMRFAYNYSFQGPDTTIAQVEAHCAQLAAILKPNSDVIFAVEAGFIGGYGEWADSTNGLDSLANKNRVLAAVQNMVGPAIPVLIRQPYYVQSLYPTPLGPSTAFTGSPQARTGFQNDCYMADGNDVFTFPGPTTVVDLSVSTTALQQRNYAASYTSFVPFGGETCNNGAGARLNCTGGTDNAGLSGGIQNEGPRYHQTHVNRGYDPRFPTQWQTDGCYTTVENLLGYRFQFLTISHADTVARGSTLVVTVTMKNVGYARIYSPRQVMGRLTLAANPDITGFAPQQLRTLPPVATTSQTFQINIPIPSAAATGARAVHLEMPDLYSTTNTLRAFKIRPANSNSGGQVWDDTNGRFTTGTTVTVT